jgi:hypothetical protein
MVKIIPSALLTVRTYANGEWVQSLCTACGLSWNTPMASESLPGQLLDAIDHTLRCGTVPPDRAHWTCIDVSTIGQARGTKFVCGPDCPPVFSGGPGAPDTPLCLSPSPAPPTIFPTDR